MKEIKDLKVKLDKEVTSNFEMRSTILDLNSKLEAYQQKTKLDTNALDGDNKLSIEHYESRISLAEEEISELKDHAFKADYDKKKAVENLTNQIKSNDVLESRIKSL